MCLRELDDEQDLPNIVKCTYHHPYQLGDGVSLLGVGGRGYCTQ